jgi:hypothetical protein
MIRDRMEELMKRIVKCRLAGRRTIEGCHKADVMRIEERLGVILAESHREFLEKMGLFAGEFMDESQMFYPELIDLKDEAIQSLERIAPQELRLPEDAVVFDAYRQGEQFHFYLNDGSDDPRVYTWVPGDTEFRDLKQTFLEFIEARVEEQEHNRRGMRKWRWYRSLREWLDEMGIVEDDL